MPVNSGISSVLVIGAGPVVIGQGCEFDYSGTQACKALREEGIRVILINSNPATIMTDPKTADVVYIEPITLEYLEKIIVTERPDALLTTVGGQTALNCGQELWRKGILKRYGVRMIGADPKAIEKAEDRKLFNQAMGRIGLEVPLHATASSLKQAIKEVKSIGFPVVVRPFFTLGGRGGGVANTMEEFRKVASYGLEISPTGQILIDQSVVGWKEFEMEVIRDKKDNAIVVCSIENIDPMGIHTGDSITVAPAMTLTDKEYQVMRNASLAVLREIGVETGGANVQFAVNPKDGKLLVIEMNPRVSRSSALASKATGFPIAKVAAKLAIGYTLDEIQNDVTGETPASFEPSIDYIVTKLPRFNFDKFPETKPILSISMHSVGEVMSIGPNFAESLQKGLCSLEEGLCGLNSPAGNGLKTMEQLRERLSTPTPDRVLVIAEAIRRGLDEEEIHHLAAIDPWFLREIKKIIMAEEKIRSSGLPQNYLEFLHYKKMGFSDARLAELTGRTEGKVLEHRHKLGVRPVYKRIDTCAAEFESQTSSLYSCYEGDGLSSPECEADSSSRKKVIILGSGPNRIGQGLEFDYACVHAAWGLGALGYQTIMVNCNPETVSTDYDTSDKLYFGPLTYEYVFEIIQREQQCGELLGIVVQFGGQSPLKLAQLLKKSKIPIIGTSPDSIDLAEDRGRFQKLLLDLGFKQPQNSICYKVSEILPTIEQGIGYPVVIRPSHVLGGSAMAVLHSREDLQNYIERNQYRLVDGSILIERFLDDALEVEVDAICDGKDIYIAGVMEHIEPAGVHSGDSACVLPPVNLSSEILEEIKQSTILLAKALKVVGLVNIQYALKDKKLFVIEANPRASRTVPFVSKATGIPIATIAAQVMVGKSLSHFSLPKENPEQYSVKAVVLPFSRFANSSIRLGPEMKSTGEVMGQGHDFQMAFKKAQLAAMAGLFLPNNLNTQSLYG